MIKAPNIDKFKIFNLANEFRQQYWGEAVPINIEEIISFMMKIDIIPTEDLQNKCNSDAFITTEWKNIYVDNDTYSDDRQYNRLRFSLAHEIGHLILHKELFESFNILNLEEFYKFIDGLGVDYGIIEAQANKFANCLLVPKNILKIEKNKISQKIYLEHPELKNVDNATINSYISRPLASIFEVNQQVVEISLSDFDDFLKFS